MKRILLALAIAVTVSNLTIGIGYSAVCQSSGGVRACGKDCVIYPDGGCNCTGTCTADEMKWVEGAGKGDEELLLE